MNLLNESWVLAGAPFNARVHKVAFHIFVSLQAVLVVSLAPKTGGRRVKKSTGKNKAANPTAIS